MAKPESKGTVVAQNRRARFDYFIDETLEAGLVLQGTEVKSLRSGKASIGEAYAGAAKDGDLYLFNAYIPEYNQAGRHLQHEVKRPRKLLLHRRQKNRLSGAVRMEGVTLIPIAIYFNEKGRAKLEIGLARGKKKVDKREHQKEQDWNRDRARLMRERARE